MATYTDNITGTVFNNIPSNRRAKGYPGLITNMNNVINNKYVYDPTAYSLIIALDIDWAGALINGKYISTTSELIQQINLIYERFDNYVLQTDLEGAISDGLSDILQDISDLQDSITNKADKSELTSLQTNLSSLAESIESKANKSDIPTSITQLSGYENFATQYYVDNKVANTALDAYEIYAELERNAGNTPLSKPQWIESLHGADGAPGKSAYELAVQYGLTTDTEYVWLQSLQGRDGFSAYDIAKSLNPEIGSQSEWVASLKGETGDKGDPGTPGKSAYQIYCELQEAKGLTPLGSEEEWINSFSNKYTAGENITIEDGVISAHIDADNVWKIINNK